MGGAQRARIVQSLALQGILAVVIVVAAVLSRDNPTTFWLTLSLLAIPLAVGTTYLLALRRAGGGADVTTRSRRP